MLRADWGAGRQNWEGMASVEKYYLYVHHLEMVCHNPCKDTFDIALKPILFNIWAIAEDTVFYL